MTTFDDTYTIQSKIGEGTFSEVLKCRKDSTGEHFAVKKLKKTFKSVGEAKKLSELIVLDMLPPHPNVVPLHEYIYDADGGRLYMVFELMDMNLYELIKSRSGCLPEARVKKMFYQILKGADHLHSYEIFHRDIKPENILVHRSSVKLSDLGSVRSVRSRQPYTEYISTRWYRSPEIMLTGGVYGPKMDVWALGCVFYEMLTSKPLFPGSSELDQLTKIHQVTGSPSSRLIAKIGRNSKPIALRFTPFPSMNLANLLPFASDAARDLLKHTLIYDPDLRSNVRRLIGHRYFADLRDAEFMAGRGPGALDRKHWSSPVLASASASTTRLLKPRDPELTKPKPKPKPKLKTSSWAPTSSTKSTAQAVVKKRTNNSVQGSIPKLKPARFNKPLIDPLPKSSLLKHGDASRDALKRIKLKVNSVSILPELSYKPNKISSFKNSLIGSNLRGTSKSVLPPISEH